MIKLSKKNVLQLHTLLAQETGGIIGFGRKDS